MITINSTKKLINKLPINADGTLPILNSSAAANDADQQISNSNPLSNWHANLLTIQRRNSIFLLHDQTRFPLFITCLVKKDFANLNHLFEDALLNTLLKLGASQSQFEGAARHIDNIRVGNDCKRSVQGTMNQMSQELAHILWYDRVSISDISPYRMAAHLADRPCTVKGQKDCIWPKAAMLTLLDNL
ncbi:hypothetical protein KJ365_10645 [Glaciecola sp. XM2]|jgi:hypothetical protein|uniref:DUF6933 domain-containing protein n=1 Tax=Glaciecola sp. XM2 TaxID=1914931 RepID=UPI001BDED6DD|nr:hypothetical protein [Glaciecola sp. XM2]MBT1451334.1 hypothetical protein [Glaciecola sp. XM2]